MVVLGRVQNGVVVLESGSALPEGAIVTVSCGEPSIKTGTPGGARVDVPLVRTGQPGSVHLSGERIAEILDEEDAAS
jgi:hypothetical protein